MKRNRKIKNATECTLNGISFRSKQERAIYKYLLSVGIIPDYEAKRFTIWDRGKLSVPYYDKFGKTFMKITRKPTSVHYTPDFIFNIGDIKVILEVKGFKNDVTPYKIRLFRDYLEEWYNHTGDKLCYAVVYTIKDLKFLLSDLQNTLKSSTFAETKLNKNEKKFIAKDRGIDTFIT